MKRTSLIFSIVIAVAVCATAVFSAFATSFTDIPADAYYEDAAERMAEKGILAGFGDGKFYGDNNLKRSEFAALACKLLGTVEIAKSLAGETEFADLPADHWATGYVNYAAKEGIIKGDGNGLFRPEDNVKYEEALKVIVCILLPDKEIAVDPVDWSKNFIAEADKLHLTDNLIGEKGEYMKRSDIAVISDVAYGVLNAKEDASEEVVTTKKDNTPSKPSVVTTVATEDVADEPAEITTVGKSDELDEPVDVITTTEATTTEHHVVTVTLDTTMATLGPPPEPGPNELPEL